MQSSEAQSAELAELAERAQAAAGAASGVVDAAVVLRCTHKLWYGFVLSKCAIAQGSVRSEVVDDVLHP
jgi:hypothetical protein